MNHFISSTERKTKSDTMPMAFLKWSGTFWFEPMCLFLWTRFPGEEEEGGSSRTDRRDGDGERLHFQINKVEKVRRCACKRFSAAVGGAIVDCCTVVKE